MTDPLLRTCDRCGGKLPSGDFRTHMCPLPPIPAGAVMARTDAATGRTETLTFGRALRLQRWRRRRR